ncbi:MAG: hypothetical protein HYR97_07280 [Candidatus Melainabacteria bacterium]|nr:hypothetical protein [Candidatus Melainabacteria bacterium]MBI3308515.1 hypothetical protein [Candidatus Melainabacteria bacterium]
MNALPKSEIKAITKLLKTNDESTTSLLKEQLKTFDIKLLKEIEAEIPKGDDSLREGFLSLITEIKREKLKEEFSRWSGNKLSTLEEGIFLIALFNNPLIDTENYSKILDKWSLELKQHLEKVKVPGDVTSIVNEINHFLFMELGFKGNKKDYYDPSNSFIDVVIDQKSGNPILLSIIYMLVTNKIGLPIKGVNMPAHFLVQYLDTFEPIYVDPFGQGEIVTREVCKDRIKSLKLEWQESYLTAPTDKQIILRVMQNLINIYNDTGQVDLKECLESYIKALKT